MWPGLPTDRAAANLQVRVSELRGALRAAGHDQRLFTRPPGYLLRAEADEIDAARFEALMGSGREALTSGDARRALDHLLPALALWRGPALADLGDMPFAHSEAARLDEVRLEAVAGSGIAFTHRGDQQLDDVPDQWSVFAVGALPRKGL